MAAARGALRGVIHELRGTGLRRGWLRWRQKLGGVAQARQARVVGVIRTLGRVVGALRHRGLRIAMNAWLVAAADRAAALALLRRAASALFRHRGLRQAFNGFVVAAAERAAALLRRAGGALLHRQHHRGFTQWRAAARTHRGASLSTPSASAPPPASSTLGSCGAPWHSGG